MFIRFNIITFIWAGFILLLSVLPGGAVNFPHLFNFLPVDKLVHIFIYAVFVFVMMVGFKKQYTFTWLRYHTASVAIITAIVYGIFMELLQGFVIMDRNLEFYDIAANTLGSFAGYWTFIMIYFKI